VYHCQWGTDVVRVVVAGELPKQAHNAPLHLFSAASDLVGFGQVTYRRRSENTSLLLGQLFEKLKGEGLAMSFTIEDFKRDYVKRHFARLSPEERREALQSLPPEERLAGMTADQIREYLDQLTVARPAKSRKPRRKK
jgi:hypothetical protein